MKVNNPYPEGWKQAYALSNRRWLNHGMMLDNAAYKTCLASMNCPMFRRGRCMSSRCVLRYPEVEDLGLFLK